LHCISSSFMRPVLLTCWGVPVRSFPVMQYLGLLVAVLAGAAAAPLRGITPDSFILIATAIIAIGLLGSRLWYLVVNWTVYRSNPRRIWRRSDAGVVLYGGILLALVASWPLLHALQVPFGAFWDIGAIAAMAGIAVGRIGCFLNGCCTGRATGNLLGVILPGQDGVWRRRFPTQLLELLLCLLLFSGAEFALPRATRPGVVFVAVLAGLGWGRFVLEGLREHISRASRTTSALLALGCSGGLAILLT